MPAGPRIRGNNSFGVTTDNPLTAGATTFNSAGLATLPTVSAAHAVIVLDPKRVNGEPEIVVVTSHSAAATVATIVRGQYGTVARSHPAGTPWAHVPIDEDYIEILTANPSNPYEGQLWYRSDTDIFMAHNGSAAVEALPIGAWQAWTPVLWQNGARTATVDVGKYTRIGRTIIANCRLSPTAAGSAGNAIEIRSLPVAATSANAILGSFYYFDAGVSNYPGVCMGITTTSVELHTGTNASPFGIAPSVALAVGDNLRITVTYEAAS